jgi:ribose transport system substrate-binding protein
MNLSRGVSLAALAALALIPACNSGGGSGQVKVAIVTNNPNDWWNIAEAGATKAAKEFNVELDFRRPQPDTTAEQKKIIDALVSQGTKGLAVSVLDPTNQKDYLNTIAARIPLITMDNDSPESKRLCYVGTDNYEAGKAVGRLVKECVPDGGTIVIFVGRIEPLNARQRFQGVVDELAGQKDAKGPQFGKYTLLDNQAQTDEGDEKKAKDRAAAVINRDEIKAAPDKVCMIGLWAYNPPAILAAVKNAGLERKVKVVGFDEKRDTLKAIEDGEVHGTVVQDPFEFGYRSVKILAELAQGKLKPEQVPPLQHVDYRVITKDGGTDPATGKPRHTAAEFQKQLDELMKKP